MPRLDRRMFMRLLGGVGGALCGPWLPLGCGGGPDGRQAWQDAAAPAAESLAGRAGTVDVSPAAETSTSQCPAFLTPVSDHFRQFGGRSHIRDWQMPQLEADFTLGIGGLVDTPLEVRLSELEASSARVRVVKTMVCAFGLTGTALWTGVPLRILLERAGADRQRAARARFFGYDGFENNLQLSDIFDAQAPFEPLIAFHMYDERLPTEHGFPFRLLLADRYGYKNIKWLERIELTDRDEPTGQYQTAGYSDAGMIEPQVMTEGRRVTESVPVGPLELCGFAVSGYAGVTSVEVSLDGGPSMQAQLLSAQDLALREPQLADTWQLEQLQADGDLAAVWSAWRVVLEVRPGEQRVAIGMRDASGREADATQLRLIGSI